jgi:hypothetical protein
VGGVGEQRQRRGRDADDDLHGHEAEDQPERDRELAAVGVGRDLVAVPVAGGPVVVCVAVPHLPKATLPATGAPRVVERAAAPPSCCCGSSPVASAIAGRWRAARRRSGSRC